MFEAKIAELLDQFEAAHEAFYRSEPFGGPSLFFHSRSLAASRNGNFEQFAEYAYAMLASWGMHRMGDRGAKMIDFEKFRSSLERVWGAAISLKNKLPSDLDGNDWSRLEQIFQQLDCMATGTKIVANSKVLAHLLPNLVVPVDREYTLTFLHGNGQIRNGADTEWKVLSRLLSQFFYLLDQSEHVAGLTNRWMLDSRFMWDTSRLKVIDNVIIGLKRLKRHRADGSQHM